MVLSSGVARQMAANGPRLQLATLRSIVHAWALTFPGYQSRAASVGYANPKDPCIQTVRQKRPAGGAPLKSGHRSHRPGERQNTRGVHAARDLEAWQSTIMAPLTCLGAAAANAKSAHRSHETRRRSSSLRLLAVMTDGLIAIDVATTLAWSPSTLRLISGSTSLIPCSLGRVSSGAYQRAAALPRAGKSRNEATKSTAC
jgi:hypothetical protein